MSTEEHQNGEAPDRENTPEGHSFDDLAKEAANEALPRGRALKLLGASLLGALGLAGLPSMAEARKKKKHKRGVGNAGPVVSIPVGPPKVNFSLVRSTQAQQANCLAGASARATISAGSGGSVEVLTVSVSGLPPNTDFTVFAIQLPNNPFGLAWYAGDLLTDANGNGTQSYASRFSIETFAVAIGSGPATTPHNGQFPDASSNPTFQPIHAFHLGLWFDAPSDAVAAGCPGTTTPFNGDHTAGIQALSTRNFGDLQGPLQQFV